MMLKILHISDTHAQSVTTEKLNALVNSNLHLDVVALTGDCTSTTEQKLPESWNRWPVRLKLAVPGNHDKSDTFNPLYSWMHKAPWVHEDYYRLIFIGLNTSEDFIGIESQIKSLDQAKIEKALSLVILSHRWPNIIEAHKASKVLAGVSNKRSVLFLHGHDHPKAPQWIESEQIGDFTCYRSHVYSSISNCRGHGHLISWNPNNCKFSLEIL